MQVSKLQPLRQNISIGILPVSIANVYLWALNKHTLSLFTSKRLDFG